MAGSDLYKSVDMAAMADLGVGAGAPMGGRNYGELLKETLDDVALFPLALPIPDHDHGLHLVMEVLPGMFSGWPKFLRTLTALATIFPSTEHLEHFFTHFLTSNSAVPEERNPPIDLFCTLLFPTMLQNASTYPA